MYRLLLPQDFQTSPWKNGGGITHEVARYPATGAWYWRISIAEVASDGPFSRFEGMSRILTVIEGAGLDLHTSDGVIAARPAQPVTFSGDTPMDSRMIDGPIRDLNVIYDPRHFAASVELTEGPCTIDFGPDQTAVYLLAGGVLPVGAVALADQDSLALPKGAKALVIRLTPARVGP